MHSVPVAVSLLLLLLCFTLPCVLVAAQDSNEYPCRFASQFTQEDLLHNETAREAFIDLVVLWEANFTNVGYNHITGMTYDGTAIDYTTGEPLLQLRHNFSAASKEAIHLGILAKAIAGEPRAQVMFPFDVAIDVLEAKIDTYEAWNQSYPGFAGFLPWYNQTFEDHISLLTGWMDTVPSLDNGEMLWGIYAIYNILYEIGQRQLADRYFAYFDWMAKHAAMVFWEADPGGCRTVAQIANISLPPSENTYSMAPGAAIMNDPYEGELFEFWIDLFGSLSRKQKDQLWANKLPQLNAVNWTSGSTEDPITVTVQQGWYFSSHEQWKIMELPYLDVPIARKVFTNCEKARTLNSQFTQNPGLLAAVNDVTDGSEVIPDYDGSTGIQEIASQQVARTDVITPYGSFPTILVNQSVGLVWYHNMLLGPRMQGVLGSTEGVNRNGTEISPVTTWDSKITTVLAILGGIQNYTGAYLKKDGLYSRFEAIVDFMYNDRFPGPLEGEDAAFGLPNTFLPTDILGTFTTC